MSEAQDNFLDAANRIGARLSRDAIWDGARCNWLGDSMEYVYNAWRTVHRTFGPALYGGTSGVALFLGRLYRFNNEKLIRETLEGAINQALSQLDSIPPGIGGRLSFYSGWLGIGYALIELGELLDDPKWIDRGLKLVNEAAREEPHARMLDVVSGLAGSIPALLKTYYRYGKDSLLDRAGEFGERLLSAANRSDDGWSWTTTADPVPERQRDLTGYSHGAAGIALALLELYKATKLDQFLTGAEQGFMYERHWFSPEQQNWPDLREDNTLPTNGSTPLKYGMAWCHGAPGIGLSRLRAYEISGDERYRAEAETALRTTAGALQFYAPASQNFSLCHGLAGNADIFIYAAEVFGDQAYKSLADRVGTWGMEVFLRPDLPWPCGVLNGGESPNLMLGLAGVGHFYLRLHDPASVESVLITIPDAEARRVRQQRSIGS